MGRLVGYDRYLRQEAEWAESRRSRGVHAFERFRADELLRRRPRIADQTRADRGLLRGEGTPLRLSLEDPLLVQLPAPWCCSLEFFT